MKAKVINCDSPILRAFGVKLGMIGICIINDFKEKYKYKITFINIGPLYFHEDEIEIISE